MRHFSSFVKAESTFQTGDNCRFHISPFFFFFKKSCIEKRKSQLYEKKKPLTFEARYIFVALQLDHQIPWLNMYFFKTFICSFQIFGADFQFKWTTEDI